MVVDDRRDSRSIILCLSACWAAFLKGFWREVKSVETAPIAIGNLPSPLVTVYRESRPQKDNDYRIRLIILSPRLSRYRTQGNVSQTGPVGVLLASAFVFVPDSWLNQSHFKEWLQSESRIDKKYFEGAAFKELRRKAKASARYARTEVKDVVCARLPYYLPR